MSKNVVVLTHECMELYEKNVQFQFICCSRHGEITSSSFLVNKIDKTGEKLRRKYSEHFVRKKKKIEDKKKMVHTGLEPVIRRTRSVFVP